MSAEITPQAFVLMEIARSQAKAANVEEPCVWYCTHLLGERMVVVLNRDVMAGCATWPGDLITDSDEDAARWLTAPPEQARLGLPPVKPEEPSQTKPAPPARPPGMVVGIKWWVEQVRGGLDAKYGLAETRRTRDHSHVELSCSNFEGWDKSSFVTCVCDMWIDRDLDIEECPEGIGCATGDRA